jgi:hypothetical protein
VPVKPPPVIDTVKSSPAAYRVPEIVLISWSFGNAGGLAFAVLVKVQSTAWPSCGVTVYDEPPGVPDAETAALPAFVSTHANPIV